MHETIARPLPEEGIESIKAEFSPAVAQEPYREAMSYDTAVYHGTPGIIQ